MDGWRCVKTVLWIFWYFPSLGRLFLLLGEDANLMVCKIRLKFYILHYKTLNNRLEPPPWPLHILHVLVKVRLDQGSTGISLMYGICSPPKKYYGHLPNTHRYTKLIVVTSVQRSGNFCVRIGGVDSIFI